MLDKIRVLQVNKLYPPHVGGVENIVRDLAEGLRDRVDMKVLACQRKGRTAVEVINGVVVTRAGSAGIFYSMPLSLSFFRHLRQLSEDRDILHFHMPFPLGDAAYLLSGYKGKVVVWWHSDIVRQQGLMKLYKPVMDRFLDRADRIIAATEGHIEGSKYLSAYRRKCVVIPFGIDVNAFAGPEPLITESTASCKKVLFIGRLIYYKGVDVLLDAFANVSNARLYIVGDGPLKGHLIKKAEFLGLTGRVTFFGGIGDEQKKQLIKDSDMLVLPSVANSEAFGLVQLEAMAFSKPVINTSLPTGVPYVSLDGQTGFTVPPNDAEALSRAIQRLVDNDEERIKMGLLARQRVEQHFSMEGMLRGVYSLYNEVLK
jgi:glycosyltransferase involved in cell wall biosynthesis